MFRSEWYASLDRFMLRTLYPLLVVLMVIILLAWLDIARRVATEQKILTDAIAANIISQKSVSDKLDRNYTEMTHLKDDHDEIRQKLLFLVAAEPSVSGIIKDARDAFLKESKEKAKKAEAKQ